MLQQAVGKTPGGSAGVKANATLRVHSQVLQGASELFAAAADEARSGQQLDRRTKGDRLVGTVRTTAPVQPRFFLR